MSPPAVSRAEPHLAPRKLCSHRARTDYWAQPATEILQALGSRLEGLSSEEAAERLRASGPNEVLTSRDFSRSRVLWNQLKSPLLLLLVFAATISALSGEWVDSAIVLAILSASVLIGYWREYRANRAAATLRERIHARTTVIRNGQPVTIPLREAVPGDIAQLSAGSLVPADAVLLEANDLFVNEAVLTGESFPVEKKPCVSKSATPVARRTG